jgi:iron complex transport system permease protein
MLSFFGSSLVALVMALSDSSGIQGAMFWILGDLARARLGGSAFIFLATLSLTFTLWVHGRQLDALLLGEDAVAALGVNVPAIRRRSVIFVALMIGLAVSSSGMIGFVGLITPHLARRWVGSLHLRLLPLCAIWGVVILTLADVAVRVAWSPYELPVGVVTAIVGAPVFVIVLMRQRRFELHE